MTFHLRPDLAFSDGSPIRPSDVVRSWLRLIDPAQPSPLAALALDIAGSDAYLRGENADPGSVGLRADDAAGDFIVELVRPASDFPNIIAGPTFAVVPLGVGHDPSALDPGESFVASGGYIFSDQTATSMILTANPHYWAGTPAVLTVELVGDLGGRSPVDAFESNELDYAPIGSFDADWISYDETLGPQLREVRSLSVQYYGFDTGRPPFDDIAGPPGRRHGGELAADGRAGRVRRLRPGGQLHGAARDPGAKRAGLLAGLRPGRCPPRYWRMPAIPVARASRSPP